MLSQDAEIQHMKWDSEERERGIEINNSHYKAFGNHFSTDNPTLISQTPLSHKYLLLLHLINGYLIQACDKYISSFSVYFSVLYTPKEQSQPPMWTTKLQDILIFSLHFAFSLNKKSCVRKKNA